MSIIQGTAKGGSASFYDYPIGDSLRFDGSSYLSRTPTTAGNQKTWTWSSWVKRTSTSTGAEVLFQVGIGSDYIWFLYSANNLYTQQNPNSIIQLRTTQVFRDVGAWGHIVLAVDTNQSSGSDRVKLYFNGAQITSFAIDTYPSPNLDTYVNATNTHIIGTNGGLTTNYVGYLANIQFIDGQALDQYFFGEFKDNIWVPYNAFSTAGSGTATASDGDTATDSYGTNGFHLTFEDGIESLPVGGYTGNQNAFRDKSHNTNHWKIN